ncbi:MAG: EF-hand domain-containing protein [Pseudoruegeria sp.]
MKRTQLIAGVAALAVVATTMAGATVAEAKKGPRHHGKEAMTFEQMDTNGDGIITAEDLVAKQAERFATLDADGNGEVSAEELIAHAKSENEERMQKQSERMIEHMDENDDGVLSAEEMSGKDRGERMFKHFDTNEDGEISEEEFAAAQEKMKDRKGPRKGKDKEEK